MKTDDSDAVRHKVSLPVKRDVQLGNPDGRVQAKHAPNSGDELPNFNPEFAGSKDERKQGDGFVNSPHRGEDVADIHGLDSKDVTPEISNVMDSMMGEITRLREALDTALNRISFLEGFNDHDPVAGCLTAPAFVRHVTQVLSLDQKGETISSLVMMTIKDWAAIHHGMNRKADESVISHVGKLLCDGVRTGDVVGHTADDEFAIIFVASDVAEARDLSNELQTMIATNPPYWANGRIAIETVWIALSLGDHENADDVMAQADLVMRQTLKAEGAI